MWIQFGSELTILKIPTAQQHILPRKLFFVFQALIWLGLFNRILLITTWRCPLVTAHWRCVLFLPFTPTEGAPTYLPTYLTYCDDNSEKLPTAAMEIENIKQYCGLKTSGYVWVRFRVPVRIKSSEPEPTIGLNRKPSSKSWRKDSRFKILHQVIRIVLI